MLVPADQAGFVATAEAPAEGLRPALQRLGSSSSNRPKPAAPQRSAKSTMATQQPSFQRKATAGVSMRNDAAAKAMRILGERCLELCDAGLVPKTYAARLYESAGVSQADSEALLKSAADTLRCREEDPKALLSAIYEIAYSKGSKMLPEDLLWGQLQESELRQRLLSRHPANDPLIVLWRHFEAHVKDMVTRGLLSTEDVEAVFLGCFIHSDAADAARLRRKYKAALQLLLVPEGAEEDAGPASPVSSVTAATAVSTDLNPKGSARKKGPPASAMLPGSLFSSSDPNPDANPNPGPNPNPQPIPSASRRPNPSAKPEPKSGYRSKASQPSPGPLLEGSGFMGLGSKRRDTKTIGSTSAARRSASDSRGRALNYLSDDSDEGQSFAGGTMGGGDDDFDDETDF
mmetsp:Transcript_10062/g.29836  ORF Transcript_10062/g.29836 Transcript_10062/m.29836 type:complete len:403 (-) Transcript_10062:92-1300(-)